MPTPRPRRTFPAPLPSRWLARARCDLSASNTFRSARPRGTASICTPRTRPRGRESLCLPNNHRPHSREHLESAPRRVRCVAHARS
eukprot:29692-Pelagococcus_subviridis.AAC.11